MGLAGQNHLLWRSVDVKWEHVVHLLQKRFEAVKDATTRSRPAVAIDAFPVGYKAIGTRIGPIGVIQNLVKTFSDSSIEVHVVLDGPYKQPESKAADIVKHKEDADNDGTETELNVALPTGSMQDQYQGSQLVVDAISFLWEKARSTMRSCRKKGPSSVG